jgi:hypothetical protein
MSCGPRGEHGLQGRIAHQIDADGERRGLARHVVVRGSESAGDDHDVDRGDEAAQSGREARLVVAHAHGLDDLVS